MNATPLPKCFYTLGACLNALQSGRKNNDPDYLNELNIKDALAAYAQLEVELEKSPEQREEEEGLDLCGYAGKWKSAQEYVAEHDVERGTPGYWMHVREHFLEIGGGLLRDMPTSDPRHPQHAEHLAAAPTRARISPLPYASNDIPSPRKA